MTLKQIIKEENKKVKSVITELEDFILPSWDVDPESITIHREHDIEVGDLVQWVYIPKMVMPDDSIKKGQPQKLVGVVEAIIGHSVPIVKVKVRKGTDKYKYYYPLLKKLKKKV